MMFPIRCFSCGKVIGHLWEPFIEETTKKKKNPATVLENLGVKRYCCKRMFIGYVEYIDDLLKAPRSRTR